MFIHITKEPNVMAQGMSWIKTNMKLAMNTSDETLAELMTDGCNMGVKSLGRYLNQYKAADDRAKAITKKLINLETDLCSDLRVYL
jgi:predicted aldo/keto reductase-like oxidoreductase